MFAIRAFVGANGGGKTLAMIQALALPAWKAGRPVCANLALDPTRLGYPSDLFIPLETWRQIPELEGCNLLLDEISSVLPSRQAMSVPPQLVRILNQLRKGDVQLGWTAPNWARCDVLLREVTQAVTVCKGSFPDRYHREPAVDIARAIKGKAARFPKAARDDDGHRQRYDAGWLPNRLFTFETYDAMEFDEFSYSTVKDVRPRGRRRYWRSRHAAQLAYSTLQAVDLLDHLDDVGTCVVCGGQRRRERCACPKHAEPAAAPAAEGEAQVIEPDPRDPYGPVSGTRPRGPRRLARV